MSIDNDDSLGPSQGSRLTAFLDILDEMEPDLVFANSQDRVSYIQTKSVVKRIAQVIPPLDRSYTTPKHLSVSMTELNNLCEIVSRSYQPGWSQNSRRLDAIFMAGDPLDTVVQADYATLLVQLKAEQYKAAVIFAGSIVEAILVFALRRIPSITAPSKQAQGKPVEKWRLVDLIEAARANGIITETTCKASDALRDSRNLVHPMLVAQDNLKADRGLAKIASGVVDKICSEVSDWCANHPQA